MRASNVALHLTAAFSRILDIPNRAGQWGIILSSFSAAGWVVALLLDPNFPRWSSSLMLVTTFAPRWAITIWLTVVAVMPVVCIAFNLGCLRALVVNMALCTWGYMCFSSFALPASQALPSSIGIYSAMFLACLNSESRYWLNRMTVG